MMRIMKKLEYITRAKWPLMDTNILEGEIDLFEIWT